MKKLILLTLLVKICLGQSGLQGLNSYYNATAVASAGFVGAVHRIDSDQLNPSGIATLPPQIQLSVIKYPANIYAQSANYLNNRKNDTYGIALRRINYGSFNEIDESGVLEGTYSASDTWLNASYAVRKDGFSAGVSSGLFVSNLESYSASAIVFSTGINYDISIIDFQVALGISNIGIYILRYTDYKEQLPTTLTISGNKGLKYLPLNINLDVGYSLIDKNVISRLGGRFQLPYNFEFIFGINSNNIYQTTEYKEIKSLFGSTGLGVAFNYNQYSITLSGYSYGSGGWIYGTSFNYRLKPSIG